jgi:hypothetical protein
LVERMLENKNIGKTFLPQWIWFTPLRQRELITKSSTTEDN